jgi:hypothetical protein
MSLPPFLVKLLAAPVSVKLQQVCAMPYPTVLVQLQRESFEAGAVTSRDWPLESHVRVLQGLFPRTLTRSAGRDVAIVTLVAG